MIKKIYGCAYAKLCVFYNNVRSTSNGVLRQHFDFTQCDGSATASH